LRKDWFQVEQAHRITATSLGYNILAIQQQRTGTASLIKEVSAWRTSVTDSTHCIKYTILCTGNKRGNNNWPEAFRHLFF
jgi:hypothetical protein